MRSLTTWAVWISYYGSIAALIIFLLVCIILQYLR